MDQLRPLSADYLPTPTTPEMPDTLASPRRGAILVVEDRDDVRLGLTQLLELHGFVVLDAADGEQALEYLHADPSGVALVLLDLLLPGAIGGDGVRRDQLGDPTLAAIPTIVVSACEPDGAAQARLRPAMWLEKPFRFEALLAAVRRYVAPDRYGIALD